MKQEDPMTPPPSAPLQVSTRHQARIKLEQDLKPEVSTNPNIQIKTKKENIIVEIKKTGLKKKKKKEKHNQKEDERMAIRL